MFKTFTSFNIRILDEEFANPPFGVHCEKTASITLCDDNGAKMEHILLGVVEPEKIYEQIDNQNAINLNNCYIHDFSIADYRKFRGIPEGEVVRLPKFSASGTFFESNQCVDFTALKFGNSPLNINNSVFACPKLDFSSSEFGEGAKDFENNFYFFCDISFSQAVFGRGDVSFKNSRFKESKKNFEDVFFGKGIVNFSNAEFSDGDVSFAKSTFYSDRTTFKIARFGIGKIDFNHTIFGKGEVSFERTDFGDGDINFRSAVFEDCKVDFTRSEFGVGEVSFINTEFGNGNICFVNTNFNKGKVSFKLSRFGNGEKDFHYANFGKGDIVFDRTVFGNGVVDFRAVEFNEGKVSFYRTEFGNGDVIFEASILRNGVIHFRNTVFGTGSFVLNMGEYESSDILFEDINFTQETVSFNRIKVRNLVFKKCQLNYYFDIRLLHCELLDFSNSIIRDIVDLRPYDFSMEIKSLNLSGIRLLGQLYLDWQKNNIKELIYSQRVSLRNKSEQFRVLKENYRSTGQYNYEDDAYVEFKRTEMKADLIDLYERGASRIEKVFANAMYWLKWLLFDQMSLYATNPIRVLFSMIFGYFLFSAIYTVSQWATGIVMVQSSIPEDMAMSIIGRSFYYSAVTFFTIGYGDFYPIGWIRWIACFEGFCGMFLMSYFTVAFVRKILR
jgi:hypothetical protein